jgi:ATP-dependent Clp protease protease subunit
MIDKTNRYFNLFRKDRGISGIAVHQYGKMVNNQFPTFGHINPYVIEERSMNITQLDIFSRLMLDRIVFLGTGIDDTVGNIITAQLLFLQSIDNQKSIELYCNSGGGSCSAGLSIYDTMNFIKPDVNTLVTGMAASMAFVLAISGKKRSALKHSSFMQHQPSTSISHSTASDILITATEIKKTRDILYKIISEKTGQPIERVASDCERGDYWLNSLEAKEYGCIDTIIGE